MLLVIPLKLTPAEPVAVALLDTVAIAGELLTTEIATGLAGVAPSVTWFHCWRSLPTRMEVEVLSEGNPTVAVMD